MVEGKDPASSVASLSDDGGPVKVMGAPSDITEEQSLLERLRRSQELLRESELQLGLFIEHSPAAIAMFDRDMRYLTASPLWNARFGVDETPVGRSYYDVFPDIPDAWKEMHRRCLAGAVERSDGERFTRADGLVAWFKWEARPWRDGQGEIGGVVISSEDITERKEAAALSAHLAAIVASSSDAILSKTLDGTVTSWNAGANHFFGYSAEEIIGQSITLIIPSDRIDEETGLLTRIGAGERIDHYETVRVAKDGRRLNVSLTISPLRDAKGKVIGASKIIRDITDRKRGELALLQIEDALLQSQIRLRHAADAAGLTYVDADLASGRIEVAENFSRVMGHAPQDETEGADPLEKILSNLFSHVAPVDCSRVRTAFLNFLDGDPMNKVEYRVRGDDGLERWIKATWSVEIGPDGKPTRVFSTRLNITNTVESRNALAAAKAEAERANEAKSKFLAAASHDLRQPVQSLVLLLSIAESQVARQPTTVRTVKMMKSAVDGLQGLLTSVLDVSRLDAGVVRPVMESIDLGGLISRLALEYEAKAAAKDLEFRLVSRRLSAQTDPALLERALRNLIENALRYTPKGSILMGLRRRGALVRIDVIDTGVGIPADKYKEIFDEFHQLSNPGRDHGEGLGLGLAIVARLARMLGAKLEVASQVGRGSRFSLSLPFDGSERPAAVVQAAPDDVGGRVLIIEDNYIIRLSLEAMLHDWGYETFTAETGEDALDLAAREGWRLDILLADHRLGPGLTGVATAKEIAGRAGHAFPTLVLTGDTAKERIAEIAASGFEMLHKPVGSDDLRRKLAQLMVS
jgi:PAS domain S-box-containing protein